MAEALMIDIDEFILDQNEQYVRYVDDIRIFSDSLLELNQLLERLTHYLYNAHRLTLSSSKTEIIQAGEFREKYLLDAQTMEKKAIHSALGKLDLTIDKSYSDIETTDKSVSKPDNNKIKVQAEAFNSLMSEIIKQPQLDLGLARHILRRAKNLRTRAIFNQILDNFDFFTPVIRDVILYLDGVISSKVIERNLEKFETIVESSLLLHTPGVSYWFSYLLGRHPTFYKSPLIRRFLDKRTDIRSRALCAKVNRQISWVKERKNQLSNFNGWERRGIMFAGSILSRDERRHWMEVVERNSFSLLDRIMAKYMKSL